MIDNNIYLFDDSLSYFMDNNSKNDIYIDYKDSIDDKYIKNKEINDILCIWFDFLVKVVKDLIKISLLMIPLIVFYQRIFVMRDQDIFYKVVDILLKLCDWKVIASICFSFVAVKLINKKYK